MSDKPVGTFKPEPLALSLKPRESTYFFGGSPLENVKLRHGVPSAEEYDVQYSINRGLIGHALMGIKGRPAEYNQFVPKVSAASEWEFIVDQQSEFEFLASFIGASFPTTPRVPTALLMDEIPRDLELKPIVAESVQSQILKCMTARPHESITLLSKLGVVTFLFMLFVHFVVGILIVNPIVSFFGILACLLFWVMAKVDEHIYYRS